MTTPVRRVPGFGDGRASQFAVFAAAFNTSISRGSLRWRSRYATGSAFTAQAISSMKLSWANVFCRRAGDRSGPVKKRDLHGVRQHALAADRAATAAPAANAAGDVRRRGVAAVVESGRLRRRAARREGRRLEAGQHAGDDVAWRLVPGTAAERGRPRLVVPRDEIAGGVEAHALIDDVGGAVVLPRHLVLARQLHADRSATACDSSAASYDTVSAPLMP